ncbi:hypothetical protein EDD34_0976 [Myceligenerans xiligouense]|uniref:Uncharacterized protein n=1 Tax=Myceligenerans xiligouense TaxID=253184 RepID=A0A3N4ZHP2_9MICO|nr:hypothetical protein EDD34_0976 [Myceligenerans xiligouense]
MARTRSVIAGSAAFAAGAVRRVCTEVMSARFFVPYDRWMH